MTNTDTRIAPAGDLEQLRFAVRDWAVASTPPGWHAELSTATKRQFRDFNIRQAQRLREAGLLAAHWPKEFGGGGFSFREQLIIQEELVRADFPQPRLLEIALAHIAATLMAYGSA